MSRRRFFADELDSTRAALLGDSAAHLARVLRAEAGQRYELAREGRVVLARVTAVAPARVEFAVESELAAPAEPPLELAVALFKFDRFEWMLEKATELGATRIRPLLARRSDPRLASAAPARLRRWQAIAKGAAEQSRRPDWPALDLPLPLAAFLAEPPAPERARLLLSEDPAAPPLQPSPRPCVLLVGPEGGFAPEEAAAAQAAGFAPRSLGPRILRAETAVLAALARCR